MLLLTSASYAGDFNAYGAAPVGFVAPVVDRPDLIIELGLGAGAAPVYQGSDELGMTFNPIIKIERLNIPGLIDIGGTPSRSGFNFAPSFAIQSERTSDDHPELAGLNDIDITFEVGAKVGYEYMFSDVLKAEVYGQARYAFGGAEGFVGDVGLDVTAKLTPQLQLVGGVSASLADERYMGTYFGVTASESAASGSKYAAYDAQGGLRSVSAKVAAKYEFVADTFLNLNAEYRLLTGSAADSPIVQAGSENQFIFGLGLSRRFGVDY